MAPRSVYECELETLRKPRLPVRLLSGEGVEPLIPITYGGGFTISGKPKVDIPSSSSS